MKRQFLPHPLNRAKVWAQTLPLYKEKKAIKKILNQTGRPDQDSSKQDQIHKLDLRDVTYMIPVRYDSDDRISNLSSVIHYLQTFFDTNIIIGEEGAERHFESAIVNISESTGAPIIYIHFPSNNTWFHRTRILNEMAKMTTTKYIVNYDADILIQPIDMMRAVSLLRRGRADVVLPYNGQLIHLQQDRVSDMGFARIFSIQEKTTPDTPHYIGGVVCIARDAFMKSGMENEYYTSWGYEDNERYLRYQKLGLVIRRTANPLIHIDHVRDHNGRSDTAHALENKKRFDNFKKNTTEQLIEDMKGWEWLR